ncbi:MAG: hypothetical protein LBK99_18645, partial [Opitutaceae bacterium]|nr:hypothetical protein [Opitutaceae bacterium]
LPAHLRVIHCKQLERSQTNDLVWRQRATLRVVHGLEARATPERARRPRYVGAERQRSWAGSPCHSDPAA